MVSRLLFICALLHAQASAVLEIARPRQTQPKAIRIAPPESPTTDSRGGAVAAWHAERKNAITRKLGAEVIARLEAPTPGRTLGCLVSADALLMGLATATPHLDGFWWLGFASTLGAYCSFAQFALLHDVVHGGADDVSLPIGERRERCASPRTTTASTTTSRKCRSGTCPSSRDSRAPNSTPRVRPGVPCCGARSLPRLRTRAGSAFDAIPIPHCLYN